MKYNISIVVEKEDDAYVAHAVDLGVTSQGNTVEEAMSNVREACELYIKHAEPDEIEHIRKTSDKERLMATISV